MFKQTQLFPRGNYSKYNHHLAVEFAVHLTPLLCIQMETDFHLIFSSVR